MKKIFIALITLLFSYSVSFAAPVITNVTGTTTRTIAGSNLMNDDGGNLRNSSFEGANVQADGFVAYLGDCALSTSVHLMGNKSFRADAASGGGATCGGTESPWQADAIYSYTVNEPSNVRYFRYYMRYEANMAEEFAHNDYIKIAYYLQGNFYWDFTGTGWPTRIALKVGPTASSVNLPQQMQPGRWYCFEGYANHSNNTESVWWDGVFLGSYTGSGTTRPYSVTIPFTNACATAGLSPSGQFYMDGYAEGTSRIYPAALVILGNSSNYSTATKVVQPLTNLSDTSISFTYTESGYSPTGGAVSSMSGTTRYVWVIDNAQSLSNAWAISGGDEGDTTAPTVTGFTIPSTSDSLTVAISTFTATDAVGVTGYLLTESASTPSVASPLWQTTAWSNYTFASEGAKTLYAWAKDAAGNISTSANDSVTITLPTPDTCETDASLCTTEGDCTTYWPAYNWCGGVCQASSCATPILSESFENNSYAARGWIDNTNHGTIVAGGQSGNCLQWAWTAGQSKPLNGGAMRHAITTNGEIFVDYYVKFDTNWYGSQEDFHPHMITITSNYDDPWAGLNTNYLQTYLEFWSSIGSPYRVRPVVAFQDALRVNVSYGTPPVNIESETENRSVFKCNQSNVTPTPTQSGCDNLGGGYWYSVATWKNENYELTKDAWHHIQTYIKMNTISGSKGQRDGIYKQWVDGDLVFDYNNLLLKTNQYTDITWAQFVLSPYISIPPSGSPFTQTMWVDELNIYTSNILEGSDVTAPTIQSASLNDTTLTVNWDEIVDTSAYSADFNVDCTTAGNNITVSSPSGTGATRTFTLGTAVDFGDTCNLDGTGTNVVDASANPMSTFSDLAVTNNTPDTTNPTVTITNSDPATITENSLDVNATCIDNGDLSVVKWNIGTQPSVGTGTACVGTDSAVCSTSGYPAGTNALHVGCQDGAGNWGYDSITVNLEEPVSPPVLTRISVGVGGSANYGGTAP